MKYFTKKEIALWSGSALLIIGSFMIFDRENYMTLVASLIGVTSIIINAKGNPLGQCLIIVFSLIYGMISWLRNPYNGNRAEVKVNQIGKNETVLMWLGTGVVTVIFYYVLVYFHTANIIPSTISVTTSFVAVYLTFRRSPFFSLAYAANDVVLIVLWVLACREDIRYVSVVVCFVAFLVNDMYGFYSWNKMEKRQRVCYNCMHES